MKVYELYWHRGGPAGQSQRYKNPSPRITQVVAVSIKQAYYVAANAIWHTGQEGTAGIVAESHGGAWTMYDGSPDRGKPYKHGRKWTPEKSISEKTE